MENIAKTAALDEIPGGNHTFNREIGNSLILMKNILTLLTCGLLGGALLAGCQSSEPSQKMPGKNSGKVTLMFSKPEKSYVEVGPVSALKVQPQPGQLWQDALQREAASRGADAVIVDTSSLNNSTTTFVTGTAIRYQ